MAEEGLHYGECFSVVQRYQGREEVEVVRPQDVGRVHTVTVGQLFERVLSLVRVVRHRGVAGPGQFPLGGENHLLLTQKSVGPELLAEQTERSVGQLRVGERRELLAEILEAGVRGDAPVATVEISHGVGGGDTGRVALRETFNNSLGPSLPPLPENDSRSGPESSSCQSRCH